MVSSSLLLLLLGFMAPLFARTSKLVKQADQDATAQQEALASVRRLFSEVAYSHARTLRVINQDTSLCSFLSTRPTRHPNGPTLNPNDFVSLGMSTSDLTWRKMLLIYYVASSKSGGIVAQPFEFTLGQAAAHSLELAFFDTAIDRDHERGNGNDGHDEDAESQNHLADREATPSHLA